MIGKKLDLFQLVPVRVHSTPHLHTHYLTKGLNIACVFGSKRDLIFNAVVSKQEKVTAVFAALADPTRRRILERLYHRGEMRATAFAAPFRISIPAISRHLRVLERARLIERRRQGRLHLIRARATGLEEAGSWMTNYATAWNSAFDVLDELLERDTTKEAKR